MLDDRAVCASPNRDVVDHVIRFVDHLGEINVRDYSMLEGINMVTFRRPSPGSPVRPVFDGYNVPVIRSLRDALAYIAQICDEIV